MRHKLKELRTAHGHTQQEVANMTGTTKEYYGLIETGKRAGTLPYWLRLQRYYQLSGADLWDIAREGVNDKSNKTL